MVAAVDSRVDGWDASEPESYTAPQDCLIQGPSFHQAGEPSATPGASSREGETQEGQDEEGGCRILSGPFGVLWGATPATEATSPALDATASGRVADSPVLRHLFREPAGTTGRSAPPDRGSRPRLNAGVVARHRPEATASTSSPEPGKGAAGTTATLST